MRSYRLIWHFFWGMLLSVAGYGQLRDLQIIRADSVFVIDSVQWRSYPLNLRFGGISGMEMTGPNRLLLVSDRQARSAAAEDQYSWLYILDTLGNISHTQRFWGVKNVEALRIDGENTWYSFETDESTGIGYVDAEGKPQVMAEHNMVTSPFSTFNRGVEGLALNQDLWYSFEAGLDSTVIVRWPQRKKDNQEIYRYPLDRGSCLNTGQVAGASLGTGLSEILAFPEYSDRLLTLERCFNGRATFVRLYEALLKGNTFEKREVFRWDPDTRFAGRTLKPDNMEGLTWGPPVNGARTLYIISDDNHSTRQRTVLLKLMEKQ